MSSHPPSAAGHREHPPPPELRALVRSIWLRRVADEGCVEPVRVLPDNCADWIFDLSPSPTLRAGDRGPSPPLRAMAVGPMTRAIRSETSAGSILLGIRFAPGRWRSLFGGEASSMRDRRRDLLSLDGAGDVAARLLSRLLEARDDDARTAAAGAELLALRGLADPDPLVVAALGELHACAGVLRVETLAARLGCTRQHLAARFRREVGIGPKTFGAILRLRAALAEGRRAGRGSWAEVALRFGYSDQSHVVRDARRFGGASPTRLAAD